MKKLPITKDVYLDDPEQEEVFPEEDSPTANTRSRLRPSQRSVTQEVLMTILDIAGTGAKLTTISTASRKFPAQFFCKYANAVLDGDSGELLEYRHLINHPKHKVIWGTPFGKKVGRLTQGMPGRVSPKEATNTLFFIKESMDPMIDVKMPPTREQSTTTVIKNREA